MPCCDTAAADALGRLGTQGHQAWQHLAAPSPALLDPHRLWLCRTCWCGPHSLTLNACASIVVSCFVASTERVAAQMFVNLCGICICSIVQSACLFGNPIWLHDHEETPLSCMNLHIHKQDSHRCSLTTHRGLRTLFSVLVTVGWNFETQTWRAKTISGARGKQ